MSLTLQSSFDTDFGARVDARAFVRYHFVLALSEVLSGSSELLNIARTVLAFGQGSTLGSFVSTDPHP